MGLAGQTSRQKSTYQRCRILPTDWAGKARPNALTGPLSTIVYRKFSIVNRRALPLKFSAGRGPQKGLGNSFSFQTSNRRASVKPHQLRHCPKRKGISNVTRGLGFIRTARAGRAVANPRGVVLKRNRRPTTTTMIPIEFRHWAIRSLTL
ncbi:hypothetical protein SETIT_1G269900v2 [Setaria italica]|uniref:Uncharacterized protein n=1 Tax=Setaria italica TaxID=4555 RepID=A0A368PRX9_SETIT|nr:hypothetical protein SETIT_1G269900v2 [Setaria italica]